MAPRSPTDRSTRDPEAEPRARAALRVVEAAEEFYAAARAYGLDPERARVEFYVPLALRVDAWLWRLERERTAWARILGSPLFRAESRDIGWVDNIGAIRAWAYAEGSMAA